MLNSDHRIRHDDVDRSVLQTVGTGYPGGSQSLKHEAPDSTRPEFNLLVAGCRGGKTSFLRLLLDTNLISSRTTKDQLASVAKFVQGSNGHTSYIRSASIDINVDVDGSGQLQPLGLTLIDTPSLDFKDEVSTERLLTEILRQIDARFLEGIEDEWNAQTGDRYIHLCIYFLDPDQIVPPSVPGPPAPLIPRTRTNSFSQPEHEPLILEPPLLARPTLPTADVAAIRQLSGRVNVLPVIAKSDILSNDRLAAIKLAIRRDLAEAGIGFGIFDVDPPLTHADDNVTNIQPNSSNGYVHANGTSSNLNSTPPTSPTSTPLLRLPYALISPDMYSHSDGVLRRMPSRHELVQQYTPSAHLPSQFPRGKFVRSYRWGNLDVLEATHSDFIALRVAIFHHMATLQRYTRDYLFEKFRTDYTHLHPLPRPAISHMPQMPSLTHPSRPILAIDTAAQQAINHSIPSQQQHREVYPGDARNLSSAPRSMPDPATSTSSATNRASTSRVNKQRTKKITVACNFCRSRKLKCDGGRPACGQCMKRSNPCDYMPQNKRRSTVKQKQQGEGSESDSGGDDRSPDPSLSPDVQSNSASRRSSNSGRHPQDLYTPSSLPSLSSISDHRTDSSVTLSVAMASRPKIEHIDVGNHGYFADEVPHIATLPLAEGSPPTPAPMSAPTLPPLRPASELQAAQRKRAATMPGKSTRQSTNSGPKVVACNFCRTRKTKCDGAHPACASCARRQLDCNYVHDSVPSGSTQKKARRASTSKSTAAAESHSVSPPSSRMIPTASTANDMHEIREVDIHFNDVDLKRPLEYVEIHRSPKKMRMDHSPATGIP